MLQALPRVRETLDEFVPYDTIPWEDQAAQLLRCKLGDGFIGLRPPARVDRDVAALVDGFALPPGSSILDLGCGPGMYANRLGRLGYPVTGIDIAAPVLDHAQAEADAAGLPCRYERVSFLDLSYDARFDAALLTNSTVNHLDEAQLDALLRGVRRALVAGGRFACEVIVAPEGYADREATETRKLMTLPYSPWSDRPHAWLERHLTFPRQRQRVVHHVVVHEDGQAQEYWSRFDLPSRDAFAARFERHGFTIDAWVGEDLRTPAGPEDETVWALLTARHDA